MNLLKDIVSCIASGEGLLTKYRDHPLKGNYQGYRDCHIEDDWVLVYKVHDGVLYLARTGTHSDLGF